MVSAALPTAFLPLLFIVAAVAGPHILSHEDTRLDRVVKESLATAYLLCLLCTRIFVELSQWVVSAVASDSRRLRPAHICRISDRNHSLHLWPEGNAARPRQSIRRYRRIVKVADDRLFRLNPIMRELSTGTVKCQICLGAFVKATHDIVLISLPSSLLLDSDGIVREWPCSVLTAGAFFGPGRALLIKCGIPASILCMKAA